MTHEERARKNHRANVHYHLHKQYGNAPLCIWGDHRAKRYEWANVTENYTSDLENYLPMCPSCHRKFDETDERRRKLSEANMTTHCLRGHERSEENTRIAQGRRYCRPCGVLRQRKYMGVSV